MEKITHISKEEARLTARLYIASLFSFHDEFSTENGDHENASSHEVNEKIQNEINLIVQAMMKNIDISTPQTSYECIIKAKEIVQNKKKNTRS